MSTTVEPSEAAERYVRWVARTGLSVNTKSIYSARVGTFLAWLEEHADEYADALTDQHVRDWAVRDFTTQLREVDKRAISTVEQYVSAVTNFYDAFLALGKPNVPRSTPLKGAPKGLNTKDQRRLLREAERRGVRDHAIVRLALFSGIRVDELAGLDTDDVLVTERSGEIEVRKGKGGTHRRVPLLPEGRGPVRAYQAWRQEQYGREVGPLFLSREKRRISTRRLQSLVEQVGEQVGVDVSPHALRHTFAHNWLEAGNSVASLQIVLGHKHLSSTQVYTAPNFEHLAELAERVRINA